MTDTLIDAVPRPVTPGSSGAGIGLSLLGQRGFEVSAAFGVDGPEHVVVCSDNLEALDCLALDEAKFDAVYIDPPYNTRTDLTYRDAGRSHREWVEFMRPRLAAARSVLGPTGVILVAIDDVEHAYLRILMDEIFGEENFLANLVWSSTTVRNGSAITGGGVDYMLVFARDARAHKRSITWREPREGVSEMLAAGMKAWRSAEGDPKAASLALRVWLRSEGCPVSGRGLTDYDRFEPGTGRLFRATPLNRAGDPTRTSVYDLLHPVTGLPVPMHRGGWRYPQSKMIELVERGAIHFGPDESTAPYRWRYLDEAGSQVPRQAFTTDKSEGAKALARLVPQARFSYPKDPAVLARWIQIATGGKRDARVLDFFAGSGSTLEAVMSLNTADAGQRRCVLVTDGDGGHFQDVTAARARALVASQGQRCLVAEKRPA